MVTIVVVVSRVSHGHKDRNAAGSSVVWSKIDDGGVRSEPWKKGGLTKCG